MTSWDKLKVSGSSQCTVSLVLGVLGKSHLQLISKNFRWLTILKLLHQASNFINSELIKIERLNLKRDERKEYDRNHTVKKHDRLGRLVQFERKC